jgi:hypothetical protein
VGDWIWKETDKTTIAITTNAWNNEQAKQSVNRCMYMVTTYLQKKKTFIIKFPSKLKKSWRTLNVGVPIIEYIDLLDEREKKEGHHWNLTNYSFDPHFSPPSLSFPFQKWNSNLTTPSIKNHWNLL